MMATIEGRPTIELQLTLAISEGEARALDALAGYGDEAFIRQFYEKLGEHYMRPYEQDLGLFLKTVREQIPQWLSKVNESRKVFAK